MTARTVPLMPNFFAGMKLTGTLMNQITTYAQFFGGNPPMFRMFQSITQSVPTGTWTQITCDTSDYDSDSGRGISSPWSYTIPVGMTGRWQFGWVVAWNLNGTGNRAANLYKNGNGISPWAITPGTAGNGMNTGWADEIFCNAGDVMALYGWQSSGGNLSTVVGTTTQSTLWGRLVSLANP